MKITYIHHSSFLIELNTVTILFDYFKGQLPAIDAKKPLVVFASHRHGDHYSPVIFDLVKEYPKTFYILSWDISRKNLPKELLPRICSLKDGVKASLNLDTLSMEEGGGNQMIIETFKSTDEGVAFWISCCGKEIYHAGDLNNWWWEGESKQWNHNISANYKREIEKLAGRRADAAFVPLDPRQEQWFYLGMDQLMEKVDAKTVFPMHFWEDYSIIDRMIQLPLSEGYRDKIIKINQEGEVFEV